MFKLIRKVMSVFVLSVFLSTAVFADHIDIIESEILIATNILFVMDLSGNMNSTLNNSSADWSVNQERKTRQHFYYGLDYG